VRESRVSRVLGRLSELRPGPAPAPGGGSGSGLGSVSTLLAGIGILLVENGLLTTIVGVRAGLEAFAHTATGLVMSAYFVGFALGAFVCAPLIRHVGHIRTFAALTALATAAAIAYPLLPHPAAWGFLRFTSGVATVGLFVVIESWLNAQAGNENRGRVLGAYMLVCLFALALGQLLLLVGERASYVPFALATLFLALAAVPIALTPVREPPPVETGRLGLRRLSGYPRSASWAR